MEPSKRVKGVDPKFNYKDYWDERYKKGQNSGSGSYGSNADFKADIIDQVIKEYEVETLLDFGCGDGNQISLIKSQVDYCGYDVSETTIQNCETKFKGDERKQFHVFDPMIYNPTPAFDMTMCLDCLFHVTIEEEWLKTIDCICKCSEKVVLIVTNTEEIRGEYFPHVNFKRRILPVLDARDDVIIEEVITQPTHKESNSIILRKVYSE